ncbi:hypothetical protein BP5796_00928 [Coleophoma crateriformis]|uniref:Phosphatidylinositol transfer protein SFH5 n=1 Tax=Coleophoma crateriformis TaxID=565419 RepID=A0A3D8T9F2_9HELO|nr:hypothetical protein BP5796_00928 [Coleophoma crateriformis]
MAVEPKSVAAITPAMAATSVEEPKPEQVTTAPVPASVTTEAASKTVAEETKAAPASESKEAAAPEGAAPAVPEKDVKPAPQAPTSPLSKLLAELPSLVKEADHNEMWGVQLKNESDVPTTIVLEKFLRANSKDVTKAKAQLKEALVWRKKMDPVKLLTESEFDKSKFGDLGYVTTYKTEQGKEIITWNIYGAVKDKQATFGNVEEFIKWRAALMELSVRELDLPSATTKIPEDGIDPYRMVQVHDYQNVSFLRMDPSVKAASKETIQVFATAYPELLKEKFFVNVPVLMGWVFAAMKLFLAPETVKKFHPLSYGSSLAGELKTFGEQLPPNYGGKGQDIKTGLSVKYGQGTAPATAAATKEPETTQQAPATKEAPVTKEAPATKEVEPTPAPTDTPVVKETPAAKELNPTPAHTEASAPKEGTQDVVPTQATATEASTTPVTTDGIPGEAK